jgi:hypothetical protein
MKKKWLVMGLVLALPLMIWAANTIIKQGMHKMSFTVDNSGDTAVVVKFDGFTGIDGYTYLDTVRIGAKRAVSWTSPVTARRILVTATPAVSTHDTIIVDHGSANDTITIDCDPALSRAVLCDSIVARINAATMSDTVTADDSTSYVKVRSDLAQIVMNGDTRFTLAFGTGNHNISVGTSDTTSIKMICDSMVATANALVTIKDTITAANSGDTVYTMTGRRGWPIVFKVGPADTTQDTVHVINAQAAAWSGKHTDTLPLFSMYQNGWQGIWGRIIIPVALPNDTLKGYGLSDSVWVKVNAVTGYGQRFAILSDSSAAIPDTFWFAKLENDTLFKEYLELVVKISDTATDTAVVKTYEVGYYFIPVE